MGKGRPGPDTIWKKLSAYQAFQHAQLGLLVSSKQKRGRYLILKPMVKRFASRPNGASAVLKKIPKR
jgi:hypothetical protein